MKCKAVLLSVLGILSLNAAEPGLLFHAGFDSYVVDADFAKGNKKGYGLAEKDLQLRGPGDFLGTKQSGLPDLLITDLTKDLPILEQARKAAAEYFYSVDIRENKKLYDYLISSTQNNFSIEES